LDQGLGPQSGVFFFEMIAKGILGTKGSIQQSFTKEGVRIPVTEIHTSPCYITAIKTADNDGYWSIQLGLCEMKKIKKTRLGVSKKAGIKAPLRFLREIRFIDAQSVDKGLKVRNITFTPGLEIKANALFTVGDVVDVTGTSKGKGFQGVVARHGFAGGPRTHGQSDRERAPGSIGSGTTPGRVYKGKKMAGKTGNETVTVRKLSVVEVGDNFLKVKGIVPGGINGLLIVKSGSPVQESQTDLPDTQTVEDLQTDVHVDSNSH